MLKFDKKKKTNNTTYFFYPIYLRPLLEAIFAESDETDYKIINRKKKDAIIPPSLIRESIPFGPEKEMMPWSHMDVCISKYDPEHLHDVLVTQWQSDEQTEEFARQRKAAREMAKKDDYNLDIPEINGKKWYEDE